MKIHINLILLLIAFFLITSCNQHKEMATNNEKARYLEWKKNRYDEPVKPDNKYNEESGFGGGKKDR